jgi:aromatic ring-cleaving dioxygenase
MNRLIPFQSILSDYFICFLDTCGMNRLILFQTVLLHPLGHDEIEDHTRDAMWLGDSTRYKVAEAGFQFRP